jgi:hypothetical protein
MIAGTQKSNIKLGMGRKGTISVMTSLWVHHCPILKKTYFQSENVVQTVNLKECVCYDEGMVECCQIA